MAKQVIETLIDDLDGSVAAETVTFSLEGTDYTIDLNETNAAALRDALAPYLGAGAKVGRGFGTWRPGMTPTRSRQTAKADNRAIRAWATANGHEVSERGRISQAVVEAYEAAKKAPAAPPAARKSKAAASTPVKPVKKVTRKKPAAVQFKAN
ncbi:Lsr2 family protein [Actinoplanes sp. NPDC051475]|uniref:histone-like nucleoid-structuring protein Lsr2 n=1 Tax=Actinoplanes sp. NPDC051475 TaxID=3157225 RepID=UPI00344DC3AF